MEDIFEAEYDSISDWVKTSTEPNIRRVILEFMNSARKNRDFEMHQERPQFGQRSTNYAYHGWV